MQVATVILYLRCEDASYTCDSVHGSTYHIPLATAGKVNS